MDHAEVLDRLESSFLAPGGLAALDADTVEEAEALSAHLADCPDCAAEYRAWLIASRVMAENVPETLSAPGGARERTLAAVAMTGVKRPAAGMVRTSGTPGPAVLAIAAGFAAALFLVGALLGGPLGLVSRDGGDASLTENQVAAMAAAVDRVLQQPAHMMVPLVDASGAAGGSVLFDPESRQLVVLSQALEAIPEGTEYGCYLEREGERTRVGRLRVVGDAAYWMGPMPEPQDAGRSGDRFLVVRDDRPETPVLSGDF
ncbi:MAG: hypothetical protein M3432_06780 [Chloroflexota bacterium]|nr:hypothetical protein [Chloroflexota bacterium]